MLETRYILRCDGRGGLCLSEENSEESHNAAIYSALEAGWWIDHDDGTWHCPLCGIKPGSEDSEDSEEEAD